MTCYQWFVNSNDLTKPNCDVGLRQTEIQVYVKMGFCTEKNNTYQMINQVTININVH